MGASIVPWVGKNCRVQVNGTNLAHAHWEVTPKTTRIETFNFESSGFGEVASGKKFCEIRFGGVWYQAQNPAAAPPKIYIGSQIQSLYLYLDQTTALRWEFPLALVLTTPTKVEVDGAVMFEAQVESIGTFNYPGTITP